MASYQIQQSTTTWPLVFFMTDSSDHVSGKTGLSPTVTLSKNGGAFASPAGAVSEIASGWYKVAGNATDSGTLGPLALHATGSGADACDLLYEVVAINPQSTAYGLVLAKTTNITGLNDIAATAVVSSGAITTSGGAVSTVTTLTNLPAITANWLTAAGTATDFGDEIASAIWKDTTAGDFTAANSIGKSIMNGVALGTGLTINAYTGNTAQTGDAFARIGAAGAGLTNIGTIATCTNLTNAPTAGDFTATMKTSLNAATPAATIGAGGITSSTFATGAIDANALAADAANEVADAWLDRSNGIETSLTPRQALRAIAAALAGVLSGAATTTVTIKGAGVSTTRITATCDASGDRSAVTLNL